MALTDINISEQLETSAPSIKYEGNEGPKSPEEQRMVQLKQEYMQYVFEMKDLQEPVMSFEEWYQAIYQASKMGVDAGQQPQQPQQPQGEMMRQPVAYGGIMDVGGRRRYGFGSRLRKLIPNEISRVAEKAAPFVAPFNPIAAGLMSGVGGFDRHGSIGKGLKSGLMNYAGGQAARYMGGAELQGNPFTQGLKMPGATAGGGIGNYFSKPIGTQNTGFNKWFGGDKVADANETLKMSTDYSKANLNPADTAESLKLAKQNAPKNLNLLDKFLGKAGMNTAAMAGIVGASALAGLYTKKNPGDDSIKQLRGEGIDVESIRTEVTEAFKDPTGEKLKAIRIKYPFLGAKETKNIDIMAEGGRAGYYAGGQSTPSDYTMEDARKTSMQDKMGGITEIMKHADLYRQGDVGQMYAAQGGRIGYEHGGRHLFSPSTWLSGGPESETNPTLFGTQDSLLNRGSIGELENAIKSYEALMQMGNLDEEQQTDYDLKIKQLEALEQGTQGQAQGGRIGYRYGKNYKSNQGSNEMKFNMDAKLKYLREMGASDEEIYEIIVLGKDISDQYKSDKFEEEKKQQRQQFERELEQDQWGHKFPISNEIDNFIRPMPEGWETARAQGGRIGAEEGGLMDLGGMEKDYRNDGGFVPLGGEEKADDVPARLSKNEFVFTADAVRGAGDGDIDKGAEIMENIMKNLEQGGQISEETQGLGGAREMFDVSERLSEVV